VIKLYPKQKDISEFFTEHFRKIKSHNTTEQTTIYSVVSCLVYELYPSQVVLTKWNKLLVDKLEDYRLSSFTA